MPLLLNYGKPLYLSMLCAVCFGVVVVFPLPLVILNSALVFVTVFALYRYQYKQIVTYLWEICSILIGLYIGIYIDFGLFDIDILYWLCSQSSVMNTAPYAILGMLLGCNHGIYMSVGNKIKFVHLIHSNLGMLLGMLLFHFIRNVSFINGPLIIIGHIGLMMFFGRLFYAFSESSYYKNTNN